MYEYSSCVERIRLSVGEKKLKDKQEIVTLAIFFLSLSFAPWLYVFACQ